MSFIQYKNDINGAFEEAHGSDGRLNVSSRADGRGYYNSRDESESYSLVFNDAAATGASTLDHIVHLQNKKTDGKHLVIRSASVNADKATKFSMHTVTGTATAGNTAATPFNLNQAGVVRAATVTANTAADSSANEMTGFTEVLEIDHVNVVAGGHEEFRFQDQLRLGQDQAIVIRLDTATTVAAFGVIYFYFE